MTALTVDDFGEDFYRQLVHEGGGDDCCIGGRWKRRRTKIKSLKGEQAMLRLGKSSRGFLELAICADLVTCLRAAK